MFFTKKDWSGNWFTSDIIILRKALAILASTPTRSNSIANKDILEIRIFKIYLGWVDMEWWWWVECWWFPNMRSEVEHPESETWMRYLFEVIEIPGVRLPGPMSRKIGGRDLERGSRRRGWVDSVQAVFVSKDLRDRRHTSMTFSVSNLTWCFELSLSEVVWGDTPCGSTPWSAMVSGFG